MEIIGKGDNVRWQWGETEVQGTVIDTYLNHAIEETMTIYAPEPDRNTEKALLIELQDGRKILKMEREVFKSRV